MERQTITNALKPAAALAKANRLKSIPALRSAQLLKRIGTGALEARYTNVDSCYRVSLDEWSACGELIPPDVAVDLTELLASVKIGGKHDAVDVRPHAWTGEPTDLAGVGITSGDAEITLPASCPVDELPTWIQPVGEYGTLTVRGQSLQTALRRVAFATSALDPKFNLAGVLFKSRPGQLELAATDGHRLAVATVRAHSQVGPEWEAVVPLDTVRALLALTLSTGEELDLRAYRNPDPGAVMPFDTFQVLGERFELTARLTAPRFPQYERVMLGEAEWKISATVDGKRLLTAVKRLIPSAHAAADGISLAVIGEGSSAVLRLEVVGGRAVATESIPCWAEPLNGSTDGWKRVTLRGSYLVDGITAALASEAQSVILYHRDDMSQQELGTAVDGIGWRCVIMPMHM